MYMASSADNLNLEHYYSLDDVCLCADSSNRLSSRARTVAFFPCRFSADSIHKRNTILSYYTSTTRRVFPETIRAPWYSLVTLYIANAIIIQQYDLTITNLLHYTTILLCRPIDHVGELTTSCCSKAQVSLSVFNDHSPSWGGQRDGSLQTME